MTATAAEDGGTAVVAVPADPEHLNPAITTAGHIHPVADSLYNGLVALDQELTPVPDLAEAWHVSDDGTVYTFELVDTARWHDGEPFTSGDVKFTFEDVLFNYHARTKAGLGKVVEAIETPDNHTVIFRLKEPYAPLLLRLDVTEAPILPKHIFASSGDINQHPVNVEPIGTGPFRFASRTPGDTIVLERNPDYFKEGLPHLDRLIFRVIPDETTQILALEQGEIDYLGVPKSEVQRLEKQQGFETVQHALGPGGGNCIMTVSFNLERPVLADHNVRQAIAQAVDRQRIVDQVLFGWGNVAKAPVSSGIAWAHWPSSLHEYGYDPAAAEALLDSAGHAKDADGKRFRIDLVHFPTFNKYAEILKQDLAKVGIDLVLRPLDRAAAVDVIFKQRDFDANLISYCNGVDPEIGVRRMYVSDNIGPVPFSNASAYRHERVDQLFEAAGKTTDRSARQKAYREIQEILGQDLPYWWLVETTSVTAWRDALTGFRPWTGQFAEHAAYK